MRASLTYVAAHSHTGHKIHHRQTSHGFLLVMLILTGFVLFLSLGTLNSYGMTKSGTVNVTLTVPGAAPSVGAVITTPTKKSTMKKSLTTVTGTCPSGNIATVYNNGSFASSTTCTPQDTFSTNVQLLKGTNVIQAQNYDALNQPGPVTEQVEIAFEPDEEPAPSEVNTAADITIDPSISFPPAPQPSLNPCYDPQPPEGQTQLWLTVPCITRNIFVGEKLDLPVYITGGIGPYALSVNWGDADTSELFSFQTSGRHIVSHTYTIPKAKSISLHLADSKGESFQMQTVTVVNGDESTAVTGVSPLQNALNNLSEVWVEASVPVYWAAVSLFGGFWIGDLFHSFISTQKTIRRRH